MTVSNWVEYYILKTSKSIIILSQSNWQSRDFFGVKRTNEFHSEFENRNRLSAETDDQMFTWFGYWHLNGWDWSNDLDTGLSLKKMILLKLDNSSTRKNIKIFSTKRNLMLVKECVKWQHVVLKKKFYLYLIWHTFNNNS